ncbi:ABC transporter permease [uncultured Anaerococcus sp.]|uniref:ABC transporter permease n=1 Tax=uncultured Anaerococcus sp. TaxID=293428 RepID=UPI002804F983|nr:ABC transporter permease [uncultured Anaerococcus sp.]
MHLFRGDLGISNIYGREVIAIIKEGFSRSIFLMMIAWALQGIIGIGLGIAAGKNAGKIKDKIIKAYAIIFASTPSFWVGILLIIIFSLKFKIFPSSMGSPVGVLKEDIRFIDNLRHMVLPCATLVLVGVSNLILHTRSKVIDILNSDYVLYAKARGMKKNKIVNKFAIKNLILPGLSILFTSFSELFSGTILVENVFNYPGIGGLTVEAGLRGDAPLLLGLVLFSAIFVYLGNRICDLLYLAIDPRLRGKDETKK